MIKKYYSAQKAQGLLFLFLGIIASLIAIYLFIFINNVQAVGFSFPFIIFGIIQIFNGFITFKNTNKELEFTLDLAKNNPSEIPKIEIAKISKTLQSYALKNYFFLGLNALSIVLFTVFASTILLKGIGLALFVQTLFHLSSLFFENNRSQIYYKWLNDYYN